MHSIPIRAATVLVGLIALVPATASAAPAPTALIDAPAPVRSAAFKPTIEWKPCESPRLSGLECGVLHAPLDYRNADDKRVVDVKVARRKASKDGERRGSIFINPGGPGVPGRYSVKSHARLFGDGLTDHYDVIGIDPRGIGAGDPESPDGTSPLICSGPEDLPQRQARFPYRDSDIAPQLAHDEQVRKGCRDAGNPVLDFMTTADTAMDFDAVREALGDATMNYWGTSYGTHLGPVYAGLFPDRVRTMVVDSALSPLDWTTGHGDAERVPFTERIGSASEAPRLLEAAFYKCAEAGEKACPSGTTIRNDFTTVRDRLAAGPLKVDDRTVKWDDFHGMVISSAYQASGLSPLFKSITAMARAVDAEKPGALRRAGERAALERAAASAWAAVVDRVQQQERDGVVTGPPTAPTADDPPAVAAAKWHRSMAFAGVACSDGINPKDPQAWPRRHDQVDKDALGFGRHWLWMSSACAGWPGVGKNAYRGPWDKKLATPALVMSNEYDPSTPIRGARELHAVWKDARFVHVEDGFGHGAAHNSTCALETARSYVETGTAPAGPTVCKADKPLFPQPQR